MGKAPEIMKAIRNTRERTHVLDTETGRIIPEDQLTTEAIAVETAPAPKPRRAYVQAAFQTDD